MVSSYFYNIVTNILYILMVSTYFYNIETNIWYNFVFVVQLGDYPYVQGHVTQ